MAVERRQLIMGGAAVVVLAITGWTMWSSTSAPAPATVARRPTARGARAAATEAPGPVAPVKLKDLAAVRDEPGEGARNPFRFQPKVAPPPPPRPMVTPSPGIEAPARPLPPPGPPPLPPIPLKFLGMLTRADGTKWAALSDGKSGPMYGKDGDIIDGRYMIVKIGVESIEMTYADGRGRQVIRMTGQ